ncbi:MAG: hypothetical protein GTO63_31615 [Anaerolineae bacterium]|nr:hypothetical protein [Anaerolineae bacterium]NIN99236.1 hypothetical protein [Anaerolineae bacterium]NIQ82075.1 hypothetical protein [Anaerolineae bacterium]
MSVNLRQRLSGHEHKGKYDRVLFKRFEPFALRIAEKVFIDIFQPELNTVGTVDRVALKEVQKDVARSSLSLALEKVGGPAKLAKALGISRQSVYAWKVCPAKRAEEVSKLSGVSKEMLRPDVFE